MVRNKITARSDHKLKSNRDKRDDFKPSSIKAERSKRSKKKFIEVNSPYSLTIKEFGREILGTHSSMKIEILEKRKASNK